jgi:hypothetical protein
MIRTFAKSVLAMAILPVMFLARSMAHDTQTRPKIPLALFSERCFT